MFKRILTVCVGNICRSPTAECLLKANLEKDGFTIHSAGLHAQAGKPMDEHAQAILAERGYVFSHEAKQLRAEDLHNADIVLAMEKNHITEVLNILPEARGRVFLLGKWQNDREIPDPYKQSLGTFEHTYTLIEEATSAWCKKLSPSPSQLEKA